MTAGRPRRPDLPVTTCPCRRQGTRNRCAQCNREYLRLWRRYGPVEDPMARFETIEAQVANLDTAIAEKRAKEEAELAGKRRVPPLRSPEAPYRPVEGRVG